MASDLVLHCLPMSHKKDARLIWVKYNLVDMLCRQTKEEFESIFHTLLFLSIYAKNNAVTYVSFIF